MSKRILAILVCIMLITQVVYTNKSYVSAGTDTDIEKSDTINFKEKGIDSENQFKQLSMKLNVLNDGSLKLKYSIRLSNEYLVAHRGEVLDKISNGELPREDFPRMENYGSQGEYDDAVSAYMDTYYETLADAVIPRISFRTVYDKAYYTVPAGKEHTSLYDDVTGEEIGACDFTKDGNGNNVLTCSFKKLVYNRSDVELSFTLDLLSGIELEDGESIVPVWVEDDLMVSGEVIDLTGGVVGVEPTYTLIKRAPSQVTTSYIDYEINTSVVDGYLNGTTIVDEIPAGLYVETVIVDGVTLDTSMYEINGNKLSYTFPARKRAERNEITSSQMKIRMCLNKDSYTSLISGNAIDKTFTNKAYIQNGDGSKQLTAPYQTVTTVKFNFLEKTGVQTDLFGTRFEWNVKANTYFNRAVNAYIVDTINASAHTYDITNGVDIYLDDALKQNVKPILVSCDKKYEDLTTADLDVITAEGSTKRSVYYNYTDDAGVKKSVLIIPYNNYVNSSVKIHYFTDIILPDGMAKEDYKQLSAETYQNKARLVWERIELGDGIVPFVYSTDMVNNIKPKVDVVSKKAGKYNVETHSIPWNIVVNQHGGKFDDVRIEDKINLEELSLPENIMDESGTLQVNHTKNGVQKTINIKSEANAGGMKPYYKIDSTEMDSVKKLRIEFGAIEENETYEMTLNTEVVAIPFFSEMKNTNFANEVIAYIESNGATSECSSKANVSATNTLVAKSGAAQYLDKTNLSSRKTYYDYGKHTVMWKTEINRDRAELTELVAHERLSVGTTFARMENFEVVDENDQVVFNVVTDDGIHFKDSKTGVEYVATESDGIYTLTLPNGQVVSWQETEGTTMVSGCAQPVESNTVDISFRDKVDYKISYCFLMQYADYYRREVMEGNEEKTISTVQLYGKYMGTSLKGIKTSGLMRIYPSVIKKKGTYDETKGIITWYLYVNFDAVDLGGYSVVENLRNEFEYELDTLQVKKGEISMFNDLTNVVDITSEMEEYIQYKGSRGFTLTIPEKYKKTPMQISFQCAITDDIKKEEATNQASINKGMVQYKQSDIVTPSNMKDFDLNSFILASPLSSLFVVKTSSNADELDQNKIILSGAEFAMTAVKRSGSSWVDQTSRYHKIRTSKTDGAVFFNLEKDMVYRIEEKKSVNGYIKTDEPRYVVFLKSGTRESQFPEEVIKIPSTKKIDSTNITNEPKGTFTFKKESANGDALSGAKFKLARKDGLTKAVEVVSGEDGIVQFTKLDAGDYTLSEVEAPEGYQSIDDLTVTISFDENGMCIQQVEHNSNVSVDGSGNVTIRDEEILSPSPSTSPSPSPSTEPESTIVPSPSATTTPAPTVAPSPSATTTPAPTVAPSSSATAEPTVAPSPSESAEPTAAPSPSESSEPTVAPSPSESSEPTVAPSPSATAEPTVAPSPSATAEPTVAPSPSESAEPTAAPSPSATAEPTAAPSPSATAEPTVAPSPSATAEPTVAPSPSESAEPTVAPSPSATAEPTVAPSPSESAEPTVAPSPSESAEPTAAPSPSATAEPTVAPSPSESAEPTAAPSPSESAEPTAAPSPSATTTSEPTVSKGPDTSLEPAETEMSSSTPSPSPTVSEVPTVSTKTPASIQPTVRPTVKPTPTIAPPSIRPSVRPSKEPSDKPSSKPSRKPKASGGGAGGNGGNGGNGGAGGKHNAEKTYQPGRESGIEPGKETIPKTGDDALPLGIYFAISILSLAGLVVSGKKLFFNV